MNGGGEGSALESGGNEGYKGFGLGSLLFSMRKCSKKSQRGREEGCPDNKGEAIRMERGDRF